MSIPHTLALLCALGLAAGCAPQEPTPGRLAKPQEATSQASAQTLETSLTFKRKGAVLKKASVAQMAELSPMVSWSAYDPYYKKTKRWRTIPLEPVLRAMYPEPDAAAQEFLLRAADGYQVHMAGTQLFSKDVYLAVEDLEVPGWEPIGPQKVNPGPLYMVWRGPDQQDQEAYARPWQLAQIEQVSFADAFPKVVPTGKLGDPVVRKGYETFKAQCVRCHAINRQGGRVGPELNVPQNITEYRPQAQIKAYIKNPKTFRYGNMPAFEHFDEPTLDALVAYLKVKATQKDWDPTQ